ncbi:m7GpppX diphosphatase-like [Lytechinus pictus]|uniref:m7GpppX diphosphatase-like n=1 Tax=Lytechinus pictus TaxID=7653 RepID=UPI00240E94E5|nr:m7GpppX diphosphatase-like [Lytechinus pictus]XP_054750356.1 m7GpppX diphosphatase-like [Lytechinus pictus]
MAENPPKEKKRKVSGEEYERDALQSFRGFKIKRILNQNLSSKSVFLLGHIDPQAQGSAGAGEPSGCGGTVAGGAAPTGTGDEEGAAEGKGIKPNQTRLQAVVLLEKTAFTEDLLPNLMSEKSALNRSMQNDIYGVYECFPPKELSGIKTTLIYPATEKHIQKYSAQDVHLINESYKDYMNMTLPYIEEKQFNIQVS